MTKKYDLIILGGGAAAFAASNTANRLKKKTLIINDATILPLGGTCVNVGCVPSKIMLHQGEEYYYSVNSPFSGVSVKGKSDFVEALKETKMMVLGFRESNYTKILEKQEYVDFKQGTAKFVDQQTISVGKEKFKADYILIATGAETFIPPINGLDNIPYLTNKNVFDLTYSPKSVAILGGGAIAMEFSQIFHHFGIKTTVIQRSSHVLTKVDSTIADALQKFLEEEGINILTGTSTKEVKKKGNKIEVVFEHKGKAKKLMVDEILVATGLTPHTQDINPDKAGVKLNKGGFVKINKQMQTSKKHIYASGDVVGIMPLETVAAKQAAIAVNNMFNKKKRILNYNQVPSVVFTNPAVATIGITESAYVQKHGTCLCRTVPFEHLEKAAAIKDTRGIIRMVLNHKTKQVVGVHMVGPLAADVITTATYAIKNKMTIYDIRDTVHVFPTISEIIKKVAQSFDANLEDMACCVE